MMKAAIYLILTAFLLFPGGLYAQELPKNEIYVDVGSFLTDDFTFGYQRNQEDLFFGTDVSIIAETFSLLEEDTPSGYFFTLYGGSRSLLRDRNTFLYLKYTRTNFTIQESDRDVKYKSDALMIMLSEELWSTGRFFFRADTGIGVMPTRWFAEDGSDLKKKGYHFEFWQMGGIALSAKFKFGVKF